MGATRLVLDPDGYTWRHVRAYQDEWRGADLAQIFGPEVPVLAPDPGALPFWHPPGSGVLMCQPRQFSPTWYANGRLEDHVLTQDLWTWDSVVEETVTEWVPSHLVDGAIFGKQYPDDKWLSFYVPFAAAGLTVGGNTVDYGAIENVVGVDFPGSMRTVATCDATPPSVGLTLTELPSATPFLQATRFPAPDDPVILGWGNMALVLFQSHVHLLRSPSGLLNDWQSLWSGDQVTYRRLGPIGKPVAGRGRFPGLHLAGLNRAEVRSVLVAEVGSSDYCLCFPHGKQELARLRLYPYFGLDPLAIGGPWWIGTGLGCKFYGQIQITGYDVGASPAAVKTLFDTGESYAPVSARTEALTYTLHRDVLPGFTVTDDPFYTQVESDSSGELVRWQLRDDTGSPWISNGTRHRGQLWLSLVPSTKHDILVGAYLSPCVLGYQLRFPGSFNARVLGPDSPLILPDTAYDAVELSASYEEPAGGGMQVDFRAFGVDLLETYGFSERCWFPIHLEEETEPGVWVLRAAAWVESLDLEEVVVETVANTPLGFENVRLYRLRARSLLIRAQRPWGGTPRLVNPFQDTITMRQAAGEALEQAGFDTSDASRVQIYGAADAEYDAPLPGTWGDDSPGAPGPDPKKRSPFEPAWDRTYLDYLTDILRQWRAWVIYTNLRGVVHVHPDLPFWTGEGKEPYFPSLILYACAENAAAAGVPWQQIYWQTAQEVIPPRANAVEIRAKLNESGLEGDPGEEPAEVAFVDRDLGSIFNPARDNFMGEEVLSAVTPKHADGIDKTALAHLAYLRLARLRRKLVRRTFKVEQLAPWDFLGVGEDTFDVGYAFMAEGRGDYICIHLWVRLTANYRETEITGERVQVNSLVGDEGGTFPGQGNMIA